MAAKLYHGAALKTGKLGLVGRGCSILIDRPGKITLGEKPVLANYSEIQARGGNLHVGDRFSLNKYSRVVAREKISIGHDVLVAQFVTILDHDHEANFTATSGSPFQGYRSQAITIGNRVWIGEKVTITKGVTIGDNVIIGAHALVNKDVPSNSVVGGVPAQVLRKL